MIPLSDIVMNMTKEEQQKFVAFLKKGKQKEESQKLKLYKALRNPKISTKEIPSHIYGKENKAAYHQLRKRLFASLVDFISNERFNQEEESVLEITKLILAGKHLIESKNYKTGFKLLSKAEQKAEEQHDVVSLHEIYNLAINFAHYNPQNNLEENITKLEKNGKAFIQESNLNMAYAMVKAKLEEFRLKGIAFDIEILLNKIFDRFKITEKDGYNYKTLYQMVQIVAASANITNNYHQISPFVTERYDYISKKEEENTRYLFYHLKLLYFIANIFFREKNFKNSNVYLVKMENLIVKNIKYKKLFLIKIQVLKSLNFNYLGDYNTANEIIDNIIKTNKNAKNKDYLDAMIVSSLINFQQKNYKKIQAIYSKLHHPDTWYIKTMGANWVMNKNLIEILTHIELDNLDYADARLESFLFKNKEYLTHDIRANIFLKYLKKSYTEPQLVKEEKFKESFYESVSISSKVREDIYTISFYAYLKAKMYGEDIYKTTLDLIKEEIKRYETNKT